MDRFIDISEFIKASPEQKEALVNFFGAYKDLVEKFYISEEEEMRLVGQTIYEKKISDNLGEVLVVSGPSGVGKDTVIRELLKKNENITKIVTATTRKPRSGESEGIDYHYIDRSDFELLLEGKLFIDRAEYVNNLYGIPKTELKKRIGKEAIIINALPQTAKVVKDLIPSAKSILIMPPSPEAQFQRLKNRATESDEVILERIKKDQEIFGPYSQMADFTIISEDGKIDKAVIDLEKIINKPRI